MPEYLTAAEAARILRTKPWPIVKAIRKGKLKAFRPSKSGPWLIRPTDLRAYVEGAAS